MSRKITYLEQSIFIKLFNRGGYVLNFSTSEFDKFTLESVGVPLCEKYRLSKGKSLESFLNDGSNDEVIKLLKDLLDFYGMHFEKEISVNSDYAILYKRCNEILNQIFLNETLLAGSLTDLKKIFSSDYLSAQIDLMQSMHHENPTEAIGKAKELIESC